MSANDRNPDLIDRLGAVVAKAGKRADSLAEQLTERVGALGNSADDLAERVSQQAARAGAAISERVEAVGVRLQDAFEQDDEDKATPTRDADDGSGAGHDLEQDDGDAATAGSAPQL